MADCELIAFGEVMKVKTIRCETDLSVIALTKFSALADWPFWFSSGKPEKNILKILSILSKKREYDG